MKTLKIKYTQSDTQAVFQKIISNWQELAKFYNDEIASSNTNTNDRLSYLEIGEIARFIVDKKISDQTENFETFFENVEEVIKHGDKYVTELIIIGLFEGIQNTGGSEIDYKSFEKWLKLNSLKSWRELIQFWEQGT